MLLGTLQNYNVPMSVFSQRNDRWHKWVSVIRRNISKESEFRIFGGRLLQALCCDRAFSAAAAAHIWNSLPLHVTSAPSLQTS